MRILFRADLRTANGYYRALVPLTCLSTRGHLIRQVARSEDQRFLDDFELLFIHRSSDSEAVSFARKAHQSGLAVVWDNDDNFAAITRDMPAYKTLGGLNWERRRTDMRRIFEIADIVTSPSSHLSAVHHHLGARRVSTIPNRLPERALKLPQGSSGRVLVGWVAAGEHRFDVRAMRIDHDLARLLADVPNVELQTVGLSLGIRSDRYEHVSGIPFRYLTEQLCRYDIGIAPLADLPMNHSRSDIKVREYASAGVPWLASPLGPYRGYGSEQGGLLVEDGGWCDQISELAADPKRLRKMSKAARKWASAETAERNVDVWERLFQSAVALRAGS